MSVCEKCWADAFMRKINGPMKSQSEHYLDLLEERKDNPCTLAQQEGRERKRKLKKPAVG